MSTESAFVKSLRAQARACPEEIHAQAEALWCLAVQYAQNMPQPQRGRLRYGKTRALSEVREFRNTTKLKQEEFWPLFGASQAIGSRYERGHNMPGPTEILMVLVEQGLITLNDLRDVRALISDYRGRLQERNGNTTPLRYRVKRNIIARNDPW